MIFNFKEIRINEFWMIGALNYVLILATGSLKKNILHFKINDL